MVGISVDIFLRYILILVRIGALFFTLPFFSEPLIPVRVRILLSACLALCLYPMIAEHWGENLPIEPFQMGMFVLRELMVGLCIGYFAKLLFEGIIFAANLVGYQMGFGTANLMMPGMDEQVNPFTALHRILVILIFLGLSFHHIFIYALMKTFEIIPAGAAFLHVDFMQAITQGTAAIFKIALQLSAPVLLALLFTMTALGLIARTVPQLNVFTLSFPVSFFVGLSVYSATLMFLPDWLRHKFMINANEILQIIYSLVK